MNRNEGEESKITCSVCLQNGHDKRTCLRKSQSTFIQVELIKVIYVTSKFKTKLFNYYMSN